MSDTTRHTTRRTGATAGGPLGWLGELEPRAAVTLVATVAFVAVMVAGWGIDSLVSAGRIHAGVRVGGVAVGGMSAPRASSVLAAEFRERFSDPVTVRYEGRVWKVTPKQVGASLDASASASAAYQVGRTGSLFRDFAGRVGAYLGGIEVPAIVTGDDLQVADAVDKISGEIAVPARDATATLEGASVRFIPGKPGTAVLDGELRRDLLSALASVDRAVEVRTGVWPVRVSDADGQVAVEDAKKLMSGPAVVAYGKNAWTMSAVTLASWIGFRIVPEPTPGQSAGGTSGVAAAGADAHYVLQAHFDPAAIGRTLQPLTKTVGRRARNAEILANEGTVRIKPGVRGIGPDLPGLAEQLRTALLADGVRRATLRLASTEPTVTTGEVKALGIRKRISKFTTQFSSGNRPRVNNIQTLSAALDRTMLPPGAVFSFNKRIGPRTAAKGYKEANAIVDGKLVPQLGGGICQVGTTIFNAVFFSGLPILERTNHSFYISHYPKGRDCTISWSKPDFRFKNTTGHWLLIRTSFTHSSLTISLYGTDPGYHVEYTTGPFTHVVPYHTTLIKDPKMLVGKKVVEDPGLDGANVIVVRTVTKNGQVVRTDTFVSHYNPKEETVRVGTKPPSKPATSTPEPKP